MRSIKVFFFILAPCHFFTIASHLACPAASPVSYFNRTAYALLGASRIGKTSEEYNKETHQKESNKHKYSFFVYSVILLTESHIIVIKNHVLLKADFLIVL